MTETDSESNSETNGITFAQLGLRADISNTLIQLGYEAPTPVQEKTIPVLLEGRDVIGQAQTGTGKTAAFALPMLSRLDPANKQTQALVLAPTRELAMQVAEAIHSYARGLQNVTVLPVYGGASIVLQMKHLQRGAQIVVGTPGRLIDHLDRGTLDLGGVKMVVLDEADEMLKMGFIEEVERMLSLVPTPRQIALFSATMPDEVLRIAQRHLVKPVHIELPHKTMSAPAIEQRFLNISEGQKLEVLTQLLELEASEACLIFRRTKTGAAELAEKLEARGFSAVPMHGDMNQRERENVIRRLRAGQIEIVVATDVAARGLDVEQIEHVINYDVPHDVEAYVHRIGRTGRAGRTGMATLFVTPRERRMMREIERFTGAAIKPMKMPTRADVAARRIDIFKENLRKNIKEGDLDLYVEVVTQLAEEGPFDMADVAAAAARLANGARSLAAVAEAPEPRPFARTAASTGGGAPAAPSADGKVRLTMAVGKRDGIRPADIVGSIANEADVPGSDIGPIDITDDMTFVVVPEHYVAKILEKVGSAKFKGRPVNIRVAGAGEVPPPRTPRREGGDDRRPTRTGSSFAPKREYTPRPSPPGAPRREYTPRPTDDRKPAYSKPYAPRATDDRKPYAKPYAPRATDDRKPYAKPYAPRATDDRKPSSRPSSFAPRRDDDRKPFHAKFAKKTGPKKPR
ncbi:MAG: ATP-dependent helicase DeaD [Acidobacteriota bacterium]|jgi:ATP-dependent RNA helicase DeaD|nr:ATP-dependent helicase DeaD [Acidobacteriota bacterium]